MATVTDAYNAIVSLTEASGFRFVDTDAPNNPSAVWVNHDSLSYSVEERSVGEAFIEHRLDLVLMFNTIVGSHAQVPPIVGLIDQIRSISGTDGEVEVTVERIEVVREVPTRTPMWATVVARFGD